MASSAKGKTDKGFTKTENEENVEVIERGQGEEKPVKVKVPENDCGCGCGRKVFKRYAQGHDAKHKSALLTRVYHDINGEEARKTLVKLGWDKFINQDKLAELEELRKLA